MNMKKETGGPAFPREDYQANGYEIAFERLGQEGMSLRDYFAAKAMQAMISNHLIIDNDSDGAVNYASSAAYKFADAMLEARKK